MELVFLLSSQLFSAEVPSHLTPQDLKPLESSSSPLPKALKWQMVFQPFISLYPRDCLVRTGSRSHS